MVKVWFRVEANHVWDLPCGVAVDALASFGIPKLHVAIVRGGKKLSTIVVEGYIGDSLGMAIVGPEELAVMVDIPNLQIQLEPRSGEDPGSNHSIPLLLRRYY